MHKCIAQFDGYHSARLKGLEEVKPQAVKPKPDDTKKRTVLDVFKNLFFDDVMGE